MNANELIATLIYSGMAFLAACVMVLVQALFLEAENRAGRWLMPIALPMITLAIMLSTALSKRNLKFAAMDLRTIGGEGGAGGGNLLRMITAILLALSFAKILGSLVKLRSRVITEDTSNRTLFYCFIAFFVGNILLPSAFGFKPVFMHTAYYSVILFTAAFMARREPVEPIITGAKFMLLMMMLGSLALAAVKPDLVLETSYHGWVPGLNIRLWGLGSNANSIGPLALTLILLETLQPAKRRWFGWLCWLAALAVMLLAQSKTAWASSFIIGLVLVGYRHGRAEGGGIKLGFAILLIGILAVAGLALLFVDVGHLLDKLNASKAGTDITTLTGRAQIWAAAIEAWKTSPIFGYGLTAWGPEHRASIGMYFAFHAHNQFLQSASVGGVFGLLTMVVYFLALLGASWRAAPRTRGGSLALMTFIALRCVTEAPLEISGVFIGETLMHLLLFILVVNTAPAQKVQSAPARSIWNPAPRVGQPALSR